MNRHRRPKVIDLFSGCGGLSLGFEEAGFDVVAAVEIDPVHSAVHEYNFPYSKAICADVRNLTGDEIRKRANLSKIDVDVVVGGAPCQGFSLIGKRSFDDPRNQLVLHYVRLVSEICPKFCVFENVKGLTLGKHVQFLNDLIDELKNIGYNVLLPYKVLNASDFGVPQNRERLIIIAARHDQKLPAYPTPLCEKVTIRDAIADLPDADQFDELLTDDSVNYVWDTRSSYARKLRGLDVDEKDYSYQRHYEIDMLTSSWRTIHTELTKKRFLAAANGKVEPHSRFFKLAWDSQANTLRAGTDSARGAYTSPRPIHPSLPRVITVREAARIHSYPDWFRLHKTKWHGMREIGNSVPPLLARAVAAQIIKALDIIPLTPSIVLEPSSLQLLQFDMGDAAYYFNVSRSVIAQRTRRNKKDGRNESKAQHIPEATQQNLF